MKLRGFFNYVRNAIRDPEREFSERVFLSLTIISEFAALIGLLGDILTGEYLGEIIVLTVTVILVPIITFTCLFKDKVRLAIKMIVTGLVVVILPAMFFFGGGLEGGGMLWILFAFMYVGLVISGIWRSLTLLAIILFTGGCYLAEYYHPEWIQPHTRQMHFIDSFISIILVGFVCFAMTWIQNLLYKSENARARKAAERAEELTRSQNRFFSSMSHEIRTPINSILGLNELILRDNDATDEIARNAAGIQGAGKMLLSLINDILDFSKMEAGGMDIVPVDYRVGDMLSEVVNMVWERAREKGLRFEVSVDPEVPSVLYGDEVRIKQVIVNMLNNAVKYTSEGMIELHMESRDMGDEKVELDISISDTGMGIKKESIPYLFDAFKRVDEVRNRHIEGTGLGLSIVKQIVDLMGGTVTVNSVYGEGSTFNVCFTQGVSDPSRIGELNIHNQNTARREAYERKFVAPEAAVLIVDDNEMNLEVECKLLADTEMTIDKASSGREALEMTLKKRYDAVLMDHMMPEMDGIECLDKMRNQVGGMNRTTPVIVLTANAGSDNRELYNRAGFDGYLVKPVSGEALEDMLIRHIDNDKMVISSKVMRMHENINTLSRYSGKAPVIITATSMSDLPEAIINKLNIPIIPFLIRTEEGVFKDGTQMDADELIRYINAGKNAISSPPDEAAYTEFFAEALKRAHHLIHIALSTSVSPDYYISLEAAKSFDNVSVINSGCLSSASGLLVLIAHKLSQQNNKPEEIVAELESVKERLRCSFVVDTTEFMARKHLIGPRVHRFAKALNMHPSLLYKDDRSHISGIWVGDKKRAYAKYIRKAFPVDIIPDPDIVFITYADISADTLMWIREEISKIAYFEHVVFQQASAAISSNCGPGTFGILYFVKGNKSYNIASYIDDEADYDEEEETVVYEHEASEEPQNEGTGPVVDAGSDEDAWYRKIEQIDPDAAIRNSGSKEAFKSVLKIFYDSIEGKAEELQGFYDSEDWEDYTIKVHALKSSSRLIGALELGDRAQHLETAGKEGDIAYVKENHAGFLQDFSAYREYLKPVFETGSGEDQPDKPPVDEWLLSSAYEGLAEAAENMDCDTMEEILGELEEYSMPADEQETYRAILDKAAAFDYSGILEVLGSRQK
ncbi:MAG: DegV family EDD domain-containing protein [Lachnospiraceae bacterium]|nr:DegV family EDD domain-containing protein [Lachnospiraceae bacterium]